MTRNSIEESALTLLKQSDKAFLPVPVEDIAIHNGIQVVRSAASWSESGFLLRSDGVAIIGINGRNSSKRQRFTIAHELGHWLLHEGRPLIVDQSVMINKRDGVSSQATDREEIEANQFAAGLLMPERWIHDVVSKQMELGAASREGLISTLAATFEVSVEAMSWRLINLGILSS